MAILPQLETAPFRDSYVDGGGRPKSSDYSDVVEALLLCSMHEYEALISATDAFPSGALQTDWVRSCWKNTANATNEHFEISDRMGRLIKKRGSRTRGDTLMHVRSLIVTTYKFNRKSTPRGVAKNVLRSAELLMDGAYHYKDTVLHTGYAQHHIISEIIHLAFFSHSTSVGVVYPRLFDPISLSTLALIFTLIEHCLKEWSTGRHVWANITEKDLKAAYCVHKVDLLAWQNVNVPKLYTRACRNAGVPEDLEPVTRIVGDVEEQLRDELEGRTGETDSEMSDIST
ncbi:hypothetical protein BYT27DRAFT_7266802 [Phlegmacium glaucopus]|nr:hypothetical protein BYT27DRAFT_7266802 [Phlegmacium glaucopus]